MNESIPTGPAGCSAALNVEGEHFWCDLSAPHVGLAHSSRDAQAIWFGAHEAAQSAAAWAAVDPNGER